MTTFGELVDTIHAALHSYTGVQEQVTHLAQAADTSPTHFDVGSSDVAMRGIIEVDDELVYITSAENNELQIAPFGRGYRGTTAAAHAVLAQVTFDPMFPRNEIKKAINQCVAGLYPSLWRTKTTDLTHSPAPIGYNLPADCEQVHGVKWKRSSDPLNYWQPAYGWSFDPQSPEATGKTLNLMDDLEPGSTIRVVYQAKFGTLASTTEDISVHGLSESYTDLILYGVTSRMIRFLDPARLQTASVENLSRSTSVQTGDAGKIANQLYAMYQQRLLEERSRLLKLTPPQIHFQR